MNNPYYDTYQRRKTISKSLREMVFKKTNGRCGYCGDVLMTIPSRRWHIDHMHPLSRSGGNEIDNLIAACFPCNNLKHNGTVNDFRRQVGNQINRLLDNVNYRTALRYGLINYTPKEIVFYFERLGVECDSKNH